VISIRNGGLGPVFGMMMIGEFLLSPPRSDPASYPMGTGGGGGGSPEVKLLGREADHSTLD
jgi:hypothetical protein